MRIRFSLYLCFLSLVALTGCVTPVAYNAESGDNLKTVRIVGPVEPAFYDYATGEEAVGMAIGGLIGGLVAAAGPDQKLNDMLRGAGLRLGPEMAQDFVTALSANGWAVTGENEEVGTTFSPSTVVPRETWGQLLPAVDNVPGTEDAILDAAIMNAGYADSSGIIPTVMIAVALHSRSSGKVVFRDTFSCNSQAYNAAVKLPKALKFKKRTELFADGEKAAEHLRTCSDLLTKHIAGKLKRSGAASPSSNPPSPNEPESTESVDQLNDSAQEPETTPDVITTDPVPDKPIGFDAELSSKPVEPSKNQVPVPRSHTDPIPNP